MLQQGLRCQMDIIDREIENHLLQEFQNVTISDRVFESDIVQAGKNFSSKAFRFTLFFDQDGKKCEKSFFVKVPYDVQLYQKLKQFQFYAKEIYMYEVVLPLYKTLLPRESLCPQFYGTDGKDALILEDMSRSGYQMVESHKQMDLEHSIAALELLAKLHALSVKVHETDTKILEPAGTDLIFMAAIEHSAEFCRFIESRLEKVIRRAAPTFADEHPQVLHYLRTNSNLLKLVRRELQSVDSPFEVLNHGDFHTNNIMFAHDPRGRVTGAKCIDFQLCRWGTPALDIMHFCIMCVRPEVFETQFQHLLDKYLVTLNATLEQLKCNRNLDKEVLQRDIEKTRAFWLHTLIEIAPYIVSNQPDSNGDSMAEEYGNDENYVRLTQFWIPYFIKEGVFSKHEDTAIAIDQFCQHFHAQKKTTVCKYELEYDVVKPGDNYSSGIIRMIFDYQQDEVSERGSVLLKIPSLGDNYESIRSLDFFHREVYVYQTLLPKLYALWNGPHFAPVCHAATPTQVLVLEDLKANGYSTCDRKQQLDLDYSRAALVALAKYHGLTVKYIHNANHILEDALLQLNTGRPSFMAFSQILYDGFLDVAKSVTPESTHTKLRQHKDKLPEIWTSISRPTIGRHNFSVIAHGDFWTNNILFAHDDEGRVRDTKIIDWQLCRPASPVLDLILFFVSSVQFEVFAAHRDTLFDLYANTLNETLSLLGCGCKYSLADLDKDLDEYKIMFPLFASFHLQIILTERDTSVSDANQSNVISTGRYPSVAAKWLHYFVEHGIV